MEFNAIKKLDSDFLHQISFLQGPKKTKVAFQDFNNALNFDLVLLGLGFLGFVYVRF